jgi:hypothetical protein
VVSPRRSRVIYREAWTTMTIEPASLATTRFAIVPLVSPSELDLDELTRWVGELVRWLGFGEWRPTLAGLICCAPAGLLDDARLELGRGRVIPVPWTLNSIVRHALLPLAYLSLIHGDPVSPELGATLVAVLADPRLRHSQRHEVESALLESEEFEAELEAECLGGDA